VPDRADESHTGAPPPRMAWRRFVSSDRKTSLMPTTAPDHRRRAATPIDYGTELSGHSQRRVSATGPSLLSNWPSTPASLLASHRIEPEEMLCFAISERLAASGAHPFLAPLASSSDLWGPALWWNKRGIRAACLTRALGTSESGHRAATAQCSGLAGLHQQHFGAGLQISSPPSGAVIR